MKIKFAFLTIILLAFTACASKRDPVQHDTEFFAMDTFVKFTAYGDNAKIALESAEQRFYELESLW